MKPAISLSLLLLFLDAASAGAQQGVAEGLCGPDNVAAPLGDEGTAQCGKCPKFTDDSGQHQNPTAAVYLGAFSAPGQEEAVAFLRGCEPPSAGGGVVLLRKEKSGWKKALYKRAPPPRSCLVFRNSRGRSELLCLAEETREGAYSQRLERRSFEDGSPRMERMLEGVFAGNDAGGAPAQGVCYGIKVESMSWQPGAEGSVPGVSISASVYKISADKTAIEQGCGDVSTSRRMVRLTLDFDGRRFTPDAASKDALAELQALLPLGKAR